MTAIDPIDFGRTRVITLKGALVATELKRCRTDPSRGLRRERLLMMRASEAEAIGVCVRRCAPAAGGQWEESRAP